MSAFAHTAPDFEAFLDRIKNGPFSSGGSGGVLENIRFIPRNFLIEERIDASRVTTYCSMMPAALSDFSEWVAAHNLYLDRHVFVKPPATHDYRYVDQSDFDACPETFRVPLALTTFSGTDLDTALLRLVSVSDLAWQSRRNEKDIFTLGEKVLADSRTDTPEARELTWIFEEAFAGRDARHRPVFAAFYEDFINELASTTPEWANHLRDRLGLYHVSQLHPNGLPRRIFLFRYTVREIPRHSGTASTRPIALPGVIDHRLFEAFCPAPRELTRGRMVNLSNGTVDEPAREILHLSMPLQVKHLFRAGLVTTEVPQNLDLARRDHLLWLQLLSNRIDFAATSDSDLMR